jgi:hypothetical protein
MRTTLALDDEASRLVRTYARRARVSLGKAASELIRRGGHYRLETKKINGIPVFQVPRDFPKITAEQIEELLDQE